MADNTIDILSLEITSNANGANDAIDRLADSMLRLQKSLGGTWAGQFANLSNGIGQMSKAMERFTGSVKVADFTRIATGLNKLGSVNVQGVSDTSRAINTLTANIAQMGTIAFDSQGIANIANAISQLGRKTITQAIANIPQLTNALSGLINGLNGLKAVSFDTTGLSNLVSSVSKLGGKSATAAASGNIEKLAVALKNMMAILSTAPHVSQNVIQMAQSLAQLASNGGRVSSASRGMIAGINGIGSSSAKAKKHTMSLAAAFGKFYATYWLLIRGIGLFKKAIDISSDLTEVQNVVDVTFGNMAHKVEELAQSSIEQFGMSELALKRYSSRFQAMGSAMGIEKSIIGDANDFLKEQTNGYIGASDAMADMSLNLTKLAADMASFYNVEQSAVAEDLESVFTGQTRPLREYGLDLTQATLQEWAMKQGLDADIKSMSQAEKTMLRYQYVMANTTAAQGDFARTANTWANQVRILAQNFQQLGSIVGGVLINAFKPFVSAMNSVMAKVIQFAQTIANALGKIFGWTFDISSGGVAGDFSSGLGDIEDSSGGAAQNLGDAADNLKDAKEEAKELNKFIAAWHEVNNMTTDKNDDKDSGKGKGGNGSGGGLGGLSGIGDDGGLKRTDGLLDKYKSEIDTLYELGEYIGRVLTDVMNGIDWESVYSGARNFGKGLADFLNGLISPDLFGALGRTIAGALNAAVYAALTFGETFNWKDFGLSIATGINEFFKTFDFASLAHAINVWAKGILDTVVIAIDNTDWGLIGNRIGTFLSEIDFLAIGAKIGKAIWKAINAGFGMFEGMFEKAPLESALLSLVAVTKLLKTTAVTKYIATLSNGIKTVKTFGKALAGSQTALVALSADFPKTSKAVGVLTRAFQNFRFGVANGNVFTGITEGLTTIRNNLTGTQKGVITAAAAFTEFAVVKDSMSDLVTGSGNVIVNLAEMAGAAGIAGAAMYTAFGPAGLAIAAVTGLVAAVLGVRDAVAEVDATKAGEDICNSLSNPGGVSITDLKNNFVDSMEAISDSFSMISEKTTALETAKSNISGVVFEIDKIKTSLEAGTMTAEEAIPQLTNLYGQLADAIVTKIGAAGDILLATFSGDGYAAQAFESAGINAETMKERVVQSMSEQEQAVYDIRTELSNLRETDPTNPKISELEAQLFDLAKGSAETEKALENLELQAGKKIDWGQFINDESVDTTGLTDRLNTIVQSALTTRETAEQEFLGIIDSAKQLGDESLYEDVKNALPGVLDYINELTGEKSRNVADTLQTDLIQGIETEIENAQKRWDEMNPVEKLFSGFDNVDEYTQNALNNYKENYIDPISSTINESYEQLGIDGAGWASDAAGKIISSLFDTEKITMDMGVELQKTTLSNKYKEIIDGAVSELPGYAEESTKEIGRYLNEGTAAGMNENTDVLRESANNTIDIIDNSLREAAQINSPSERMKPIGEYLLLGVVEGFNGASPKWETAVSTWADTTFAAFQTQTSITISEIETLFSGLPEKIYNAIFPLMEWIVIWGDEMYTQFDTESNESITKVVDLFSELPEKIYDVIVRFVNETLPRWSGEINDFFSSEIPNIVDNVVDLFAELPGELEPVGEDAVVGLWEGFDNKSGWIGGKISGFCQRIIKKFKSEFDEHSPSKVAFGIGDFFTLGLGNGIIDRFGDIYKDVTDFASGLTSLNIDLPQINYSVPQPDFSPKSYNLGALQSTMQMEMDVKMAEMEYQNRQLRDIIEESNSILQQIKNQGIILDDNEFNRRYKSGATKYRKQTGRQLGVSY